MTIAITKTAMWLPDGYESSAAIAQQSNLPELVVREKMGIRGKYRAGCDEHPSHMAINAARAVLVDIDPLSIDLVIWTGSEYKDYIVWSAGIFVQRELGLRNAFAFDLGARCSTNVLALDVARSMMTANPAIKRTLLCGGHKTSELVNYQDPNSRFLYNLSDGGSAILIERANGNPILGSSIITDGDFSLDVIVPGGGTRAPWRNRPDTKTSYLSVPDLSGMRNRLAEKSLENFVKVIRTAATSSTERPIDYLALLHMKRSAHDELLDRLELRQDQSIYLDEYGHFGAPDQVLSLGLAEQRKILKPGDHVVLASAGIGYTWSAISLRWDRPTFVQSSIKKYHSPTFNSHQGATHE